MGPELIFVHFPKAGGTSLVRGLSSHYGDALILDYEHLPPLDWSGDPPRLSDRVRAVCGHFHGNRYQAYTQAFRFTFLREPVANLISIFYFWLDYPRHGFPAHDRFLAERPTIFEFAEYAEMKRLSSVAYFGGVDLDQFEFVGFYERRQDDVAKLSALIGVDLDSGLHVNKTDDKYAREREDLMADSGAMMRLRAQLADDVALYEQTLESWA